jgi:hypothetical protein
MHPTDVMTNTMLEHSGDVTTIPVKSFCFSQHFFHPKALTSYLED